MAGDSAIKHSPVKCRESAYTQSRDYAIEESALKALLVDLKGGGDGNQLKRYQGNRLKSTPFIFNRGIGIKHSLYFLMRWFGIGLVALRVVGESAIELSLARGIGCEHSYS